MTFIEFMLASGATCTILLGLQQVLMWGLQRRATKKDGVKKSIDVRLTDVETMITSLVAGQRAILHDRIKWLGVEYLRQKAISLDNRKDLIDMHYAYKALGGNGNLNALMDEVLDLQLKAEK